jgi:hypothetical protein
MEKVSMKLPNPRLFEVNKNFAPGSTATLEVIPVFWPEEEVAVSTPLEVSSLKEEICEVKVPPEKLFEVT